VLSKFSTYSRSDSALLDFLKRLSTIAHNFDDRIKPYSHRCRHPIFIKNVEIQYVVEQDVVVERVQEAVHEDARRFQPGHGSDERGGACAGRTRNPRDPGTGAEVVDRTPPVARR